VFPRSCGLLLHLTSLPDGRLGRDAYRFVDFCARAGQRWWQMLPVVPPGAGGSPYAALSAFAGSESLLARGPAVDAEGFAAFRRREASWLGDYALFRALRERYRERAWTRWPPRLRDRDPDALARARDALASAIARYERDQYRFATQWAELRVYAAARGVGLIGDVPIFVAHDSADVWAHRDLFKLDARGRPTVVTGVPPDYFSRRGQRWGNPHYRWDVARRRRYRWWLARLARALALFDAVRLDHFLGFLRAWEIPARARTARRGRWAKGPGEAFFRAVATRFGAAPLIAEDLGLLTPEAAALRDRHGLPGMRVLQFSFGPDASQRPHAFPRNCVVYTGTHDNDTAAGWFRAGGPDARRALLYAGGTAARIHEGLIRVAYTCPADLAIVPVQDVLGLGGRARMNRPGEQGGNWGWRLRRGELRPALARRLRALAEVAGR